MLNFSIDITEQFEDGTEEVRTVKASLYDSPQEITLSRWASYFVELEKQPDWFKDFHNAETEEAKKELQKAWDAIQWGESYVIIGKLCLMFIESASLSDLMELPMYGDNSLFSLFLQVVETVYGYKPKAREYFKWKGRKFKAFTSKVIAGAEMPGADMTVRDAVTALQLEHAWKQQSGVNDFNINIGVLSALTREVTDGKVEKMPVDGPALLQWQFDRQMLFEDITMDIALDVVFFSTHLKALSQRIPLYLSCLLRPATED
jgi:hypothetical protein